MAKAYWIAFYRSIKNPDALAAYAKLAGPAVQAAGGRFLARGMPSKVYEAGGDSELLARHYDAWAASYDEDLVALGPRRILMPAGNPVTRRFYDAHGIECIEVVVDELAKAAGAIGCLSGIVERTLAS